MAIEIVDFPINSMVIFHGKMLVHQRVYDFPHWAPPWLGQGDFGTPGLMEGMSQHHGQKIQMACYSQATVKAKSPQLAALSWHLVNLLGTVGMITKTSEMG